MDRASQKLLERLPLAADRPAIGYVAAILISGAALCVRFAADRVLPGGYPFVAFFPAVIVSAFLFGRGPGTLSAAVCGLVAWYVFIPPRYGFRIDGEVLLSLTFYIFVVTIDIALVHWMQRANRWLAGERARSAALAERSELLFRELQHRVSNNLQVVAALIALQRRNVADKTAAHALDEASRRLGIIGRIQRQLHSPNGELLGGGDFLRQLADDLLDAAGGPRVRCLVEADRDIALDPDHAVPVALIAAEAIANALEHGLAGRDDGTILIRLRRSGRELELAVSDNGAGLAEGFDPAQLESLGLRIASAMARQLGGHFQISGGHGATARLVWPAAAAPRGTTSR